MANILNYKNFDLPYALQRDLADFFSKQKKNIVKVIDQNETLIDLSSSF